MDYQGFVERLLKARVLKRALVELPRKGATNGELAAARDRIGPLLDAGLLEFYAQWNGADLDAIRIYGTGQLRKDAFGLVFGSDASGFVYRFDGAGRVTREDTDGSGRVVVAKDFRDFIFGYVFGPRAREFAGDDWLESLHGAGMP
jgi:hypothetical protein